MPQLNLQIILDGVFFVFLLTVVIYLNAGLFFGGYISGFLDKMRLPFGFSDFSLTDLIGVFPNATLTAVSLISDGWKKFLMWLLTLIGAPFVIGFVILLAIEQFGLKVSFSFESNTIRGLIIIGLWTFGIFRASGLLSKVTDRILMLLQGLLLALWALNPTATQWVDNFYKSNPFFSLIGNLIFIVCLLFIIFIGPFLLGNATANYTRKNNRLNPVKRLVLTQPAGPQENRLVSIPLSNRQRLQRKFWGLPVESGENIYTHTAENPLYYITAFRTFTLLYRPGQGETPDSVLSIANTTILSIEVQ